MNKLLIFVVIFAQLTNEAFLWSNHDISTLKVLQIMHRHGERNPLEFLPNDPFSKNISVYWPEGVGQLTNEGKRRMYKLGQIIRREYDSFLGDEYSPREVYARSSISGRCIESAQLLLAGAYPPNNTDWQWNNGTDSQLGRVWQPISIDTFMPKADDALLNVDKHCPKAEEVNHNILNSDEVLKLFDKNKPFLDQLSEKAGTEVNTLKLAERLFVDMMIEQNRGLKWSDMKVWSPEFERTVFNKLQPLARLLWNIEWDHPLIEKVRAGPLIDQLINNFKAYIEGKPIENSVEKPYKLFEYSTHDNKLVVLMNALNIYNWAQPPYGATLLFELHQTPGAVDYSVKIYYFNETLSDSDPHLMTLKDCDNREVCPFDRFVEITRKVIPNDWNTECGISSEKKSIFISNIVALVINLILLITLTALIVYNCYDNNRSSYIPLDGQ